MRWNWLDMSSNYYSLRTSEIHLFYNLQVFYWHFLEILWLFIFLVLYSLWASSFVILFLSYLFVILSLISEFGGGTGWTLYPPLSTSFMSLSPSSTAYLIFGLLMSGISSCLTSLNFWTTIQNMRSYYLTLNPFFGGDPIFYQHLFQFLLQNEY